REPQMHRISKQSLELYEDYYYFDYAIEHLKHKKYRDIYEHWKKADEIIEEFNKTTKFADKLAETIKTKISIEFPEFTTKKNIEDFDGNFYDLGLIFDFISDVMKNEKPDDYINFLKIGRSNDGIYSICTKRLKFYGQLTSKDENKIDLDRYKQVIKSIIQDTGVQKSLESDTKKRHDLISEQQKFSMGLEGLIKKLKAGSLIEGKCEGCSTFS
ncbi:MAG: hypothetical protein KGI25_03005, partial [Thaumarchaeota archaeon]|nr:hypothetical protein [Nitrososphaerota archaeon]